MVHCVILMTLKSSRNITIISVFFYSNNSYLEFTRLYFTNTRYILNTLFLIAPYRANAEISRVQNAAKTELAGLQAALKREKTKNSSLQQSLDQKVSDGSHNRRGFKGMFI